ncbi:MAG: hypothetical protein WBC40_09460 [Halobacteriota archaeon]
MAVSIEERVSKVEGTVSEHDRIFDMIHGEIRDVKVSVDNRIDDFREDMNIRFDEAKEETNRRFDETNRRIDKLDGRIDKLDGRMDETNKRIAEMDFRLTSRMDSTLKWIVAIQIPTWMMIITMWVTLILRIG